jgi:2,4-dienoyl-CoA reductase-like NADH-dependent reductase (Old Yellow Enzyme family)
MFITYFLFLGSNTQVSDVETYGPSAVANLGNGKIPKELTIDQIKAIQQKFVAAAVRAKDFGYDGIEIHGTCFFFFSLFFRCTWFFVESVCYSLLQ